MADLRIVDAPVLLQESITDDVKMPTGGLGNFSIRLGDIVWYVVARENLASKNYVDLSSKGVKDSLDVHIADKANPHNVTKAQVGLGNVDNTADIDKPVSNAVNSAIITATNDMATKTYVNQKDNLKADVAYVNSKDGDLTTLTTTDKTSLVKAINEVVSVKANKADVALSISNLTNNKADKATTLEGYGISDAYTKSEIDTDYGGVKTLYEKNVEAGAGVNGWTADLVLDSTQNKTQSQINSNQEKLNTVLNKIGTTETLAESVDATPFLQSLINAMPDGMTLDLLGKTFTVKKNTGFQSLYPKNDQPCLVVHNKKNIKIINGKLKVSEHGQGIIEFVNCPNWLLEGVELEGFGNNFPPLDRSTGRGEKGGVPTEGYYYNADGVLPRNNSVDTSNRTAGGYGGAFPQFGGGTASTWGMWGGGYICNMGAGVSQKYSYGRVERCKIHGFNGEGIYAENYKYLIAMHNEIYDCYTSGIQGYNFNELAHTPEMLLAAFNTIHHIGHPDASVNHSYIDPGYGISTGNSNGTFGRVKVYITQGNIIYDCKRKGIDSHSADIVISKDNTIDRSGFGIAIGTTFGNNHYSVTITDNTITNIQYSATDQGSGIKVSGTGLTVGTVKISGNTIKNVGREITNLHTSLLGIGIFVAGIREANVYGNSVTNDSNFAGLMGISNAINAATYCPSFIANGNTVRGLFNHGLFLFGNLTADADKQLTKRMYQVYNNTIHLYNLSPLGFNIFYNCINGLQTAKMSGNTCLLDDYSQGRYYNPTNGRVSAFDTEFTLRYVKTAEGYTLSMLKPSNDLPINMSDVVHSVANNVLTITLPNYYPYIVGAEVVTNNLIKNSANLYVNSISTVVSDKVVTLALNNIAVTVAPVNWTDLSNACQLSIKLSF